ncbi:RNA-binding protein NOB1-like [Acropora millepora]|uniref:RNA-binding protein NOB1-like n=1 Tax=Acropora millepora TaxID=45264 RepID=UPI001CF43F5A|nr:RNA-binding protein NOB1-like [Acropora millepora]
MAEKTNSKLEYIVADSAAFIKNAPLHNLCENVYTVEDVIKEIRSKATRQRLSVLPYRLNFRQPSAEAVLAVTNFSKLTGDYKGLSSADLRVLALTYQLEKENCGTDHIKTTPSKQVSISRGFNGNVLPGFFVEEKLKGEGGDSEPEEEDEVNDCHSEEEEDSEEHLIPDKLPEEISSSERDESFLMDELNSLLCNSVDNEEGTPEEIENHNLSYDMDHGWITPDNITHVKNEIGESAINSAAATNVVVGCLTTDFAMQNVLIQMGLHVISLDGMLIREVRSYVLKCHACFRVTRQLQKKFCPWCGNNTLLRIPMTIDDQGETRFYLPKRSKPFNIKSKKFSLPLPRGGRQGLGPVLTEDQPRSHNRLPRSKDRVNVFDADYVTRASPFLTKDVNSRACQLGYHLKGSLKERNQNQVRKKSGRRKRS